jgi:hypothetical protein
MTKKILYTITGIAIGIVASVQAASIIFPYQGGTGTSTAPTLGQVLVGQADGKWGPQATSTLGISGGSSQWVTTGTTINYPLGFVGIGSSTPGSALSVGNTLSVSTSSIGLTDFNFQVATTSLNYFFGVQGNGHITASSSAPTLSSCGTSPSVVRGNDTWGRIVTGGGVITACTVTFANTYALPPVCDANPEGGVTTFIAASSTATGFVITGASAITSTTITYQCYGVGE